MKTKILAILAVFALAIARPGIAQDNDNQLRYSFSNPNKPGFINVELFQGNVDITGYSGKEVIIDYTPPEGELQDLKTIPKPEHRDMDDENEEVSTEGLNKIKSSSFDINVAEGENKITIKSGSPMSNRNLTITVPYNCSFKISTVNGNISVKEVKGQMEIATVNGKIDLDKITGSAIASTVNGLLRVLFSDVTPDTPMAFSTVNSHIDVTLPSDTKATLKMKTEFGDIYSNFDVEVKEEQVKSDKSEKYGHAATNFSNWTTARINGGGPEFVFKSLNGNIHVRKGQ
jgi:DUF4097 and DUF4098 domain-containing protein YvlB